MVFMVVFNFIRHLFLLHSSSPIDNINGGGSFFDDESGMNINWFYVTISLGRFQRFLLNNLNVYSSNWCFSSLHFCFGTIFETAESPKEISY
jgi:hypothetical protein